MTRITKILGFTIVLLSPVFVFAQSVGPIFNEKNCTTGTTLIPYYCTLCDLLAVIQSTINYGLILIVPIAALIIIYGGFLIMTAGGNVANVGKGRTAIFSAIIGVAIALGGWLIVNTVMSYLAVGEFKAPWYEITCNKGAPPAVATPPAPTGGTHLACQDDACVSVDGAGANECTDDFNCGVNAVHLACQNNTCVAVDGTGTDQCVKDSACEAPPTADEKGLAQIVLNDGVCGGTASCGGVNSCSTLRAVAAGDPPPVCFNGCGNSNGCSPNPNVHLSTAMLTAIDSLKTSDKLSFTVSSLTTGSHSSGSLHYQGKAVDLVASGGTSYTQLETKLNEKSGISYLQCENLGGSKIPCSSSGVAHIHAEFR